MCCVVNYTIQNMHCSVKKLLNSWALYNYFFLKFRANNWGDMSRHCLQIIGVWLYQLTIDWRRGLTPAVNPDPCWLGHHIAESEIFYPELKKNSHLFSPYTGFSVFMTAALSSFLLSFTLLRPFPQTKRVCVIYGLSSNERVGGGGRVMEGCGGGGVCISKYPPSTSA